MAALTRPGQYKVEGRLWTFALNGDLPVEPVRGRERPPLSVIASSATPDRIADGGDLYARFCQRCHGPNAASGGAISDLRYAAPATFDRFDDIVRRGVYVPLGMPAFDWFGDDDLDALRNYVLSRREALMSASVE